MTTKTEKELIKETESAIDAYIEKNTGVVIQTLSERGDIKYFIDTGAYAMNWAITNDFWKGFPGARTSVIGGEPGKGKSLLLDSVLGGNIRDHNGYSVKIDIEDAGGLDFTSKIVGDREIAKKIRVIEPKEKEVITIKRFAKVMNDFIDVQASRKEKKNPSLMVGLDSISQLLSDKEYQDAIAEVDKRDMTYAQEMKKLLRVITQRMRKSNVSLIGIGQMIANIQTKPVFGAPKSKVSLKGSAFEYMSSLIIQMISDKEIKKKSKGAVEIPIGIRMKMKTVKNRVEFKGRQVWLDFYFNQGIDRYGGLTELLADYGVLKSSKAAQYPGAYEEATTFSYPLGEMEETRLEVKKTKKFEKDKEKLLKDGWEEKDTVTNGKAMNLLFSRQKRLVFKPKDIKKVVEENGGEELLHKWNEELNIIYKDLTKDTPEEELLATDECEGEIEETE